MRWSIAKGSIVVAIAFLFFVFARAVVLTKRQSTYPRLMVSYPTINFGRIPTRQPVRHRFTLSNIGGAPLLILSTKSNCECTIGHLASRALASGQSTALDVTFTPKKAGEHRKVFVLVKSNDPQHPLTILTLTADVVKNVAAATTREAHL